MTNLSHCADCIFQESKGYEFESETDTETIAKLIKYVFDNRETEDITFSTLVERVIQQLVSYKSRLTHSFVLSLKTFFFKQQVPRNPSFFVNPY